MKSRIPNVTVPTLALHDVRSTTAAAGLAALFWLAACGGGGTTATPNAGTGTKADASRVSDATATDAADGPTIDAAAPPDVASPDIRLDVAGSDAARAPGPDAAPPSVDAAIMDVGEQGLDTASTEAAAVDTLALPGAVDTQSAFTCSSLGVVPSDVAQRLCFDFSDASQGQSFAPEAGTWSVAGGSYLGVGPAGGQVTCPGGPFGGSAMTASVLSTLSATDVRVHARMTSITRPDKVLVLRAQPSGDRIELDFRSYFTIDGTQYGGDFVVSMLSQCNQIFFVPAGTIPVPQFDDTPIDVDVQLVGGRLTVSIDGKPIYDASPMATGIDGGTRPLPSQPGSVGFGVFMDGEVAFDDLIVEVLK